MHCYMLKLVPFFNEKITIIGKNSVTYPEQMNESRPKVTLRNRDGYDDTM